MTCLPSETVYIVLNSMCICQKVHLSVGQVANRIYLSRWKFYLSRTTTNVARCPVFWVATCVHHVKVNLSQLSNIFCNKSLMVKLSKIFVTNRFHFTKWTNYGQIPFARGWLFMRVSTGLVACVDPDNGLSAPLLLVMNLVKVFIMRA